jgi:glycosyltransferase involved in cell wall biosynthesis
VPEPILFVHHRSELGGAPTSLSYLIRHLDRSRFDPHVFCPPGPASQLFREAGATVHEGPVAGFTHIWASTYRGRRWLLFVRELLRLPLHVLRFRRVLRSEKFALVHLNDSPLVAAAFTARLKRIPIVWQLRSALPGTDDLRSRLLQRAIRRLANVTVAINEDVAASFAVGAVVIPNSVDLARFAPGDTAAAKGELGLPRDLPTIAYFGFIYPSKGFREFLETAALLRSRGLEARYLVVGGAVRSDAFFRTLTGRMLEILDLARNYYHEAQQLVAELGVDDIVRFIPFTAEPARIYQASDLVVSPSRGPELGRPVLEAAASGVPVIASGSRTGGGVVVPGETALLVKGTAPSTLAQAIVDLIENPARRKRMGATARVYAEQRLDPERNARAIEALYARLIPTLKRPMPILFVHHRPQLGGAPVSLVQLIQTLGAEYEPHVLVPPGPAAELFAAAGATVHTGRVAIFSHTWDSPYRGFRWLILLRELFALPPHLLQVRALMREYGFPIVHLNDSPILAAAFVARRHGARIVWHLRSALAYGGRDRRGRGILALMTRLGDKAIAIDTDVASTFRLGIPITVVHNAASPHALPLLDAEYRAKLGLPLDQVVVAFAGFIRHQKGWPELVEAVRILVGRGQAVHVVIMGGGVRPPAYFRTIRGRLLTLFDVLRDEETAIRRMVAEYELEGHFTFVPFMSDPSAIYRASDIVAFPNQGIGLGRPVLEAAAHGRPVVASGSRDGGGILRPEVTGILLDEPTPEAIAAALSRLASDSGLRRQMGEQAALHARAHFDASRNTREVIGVYEEQLGFATHDDPDPAVACAETEPEREPLHT